MLRHRKRHVFKYHVFVKRKMFSSFLIFVTIDRFDRKGHLIHYPHRHLLIVSGLFPPVTEGGMTSWFIQASNSLCWRVQTINLLFKGFTAEYLDEVKPDILVSERQVSYLDFTLGI